MKRDGAWSGKTSERRRSAASGRKRRATLSVAAPTAMATAARTTNRTIARGKDSGGPQRLVSSQVEMKANRSGAAKTAARTANAARGLSHHPEVSRRSFVAVGSVGLTEETSTRSRADQIGRLAKADRIRIGLSRHAIRSPPTTRSRTRRRQERPARRPSNLGFSTPQSDQKFAQAPPPTTRPGLGLCPTSG